MPVAPIAPISACRTAGRFMNAAKRGRPCSSAKSEPCTPASTDCPARESGSIAVGGAGRADARGVHSITRATRVSSAFGRPDAAVERQGLRDLAAEERAEADVGNPPHELTDQPAVRQAVIAVSAARPHAGSASAITAAIAAVSLHPAPSHDSRRSAPGTPMAPDRWLSTWRTSVVCLARGGEVRPVRRRRARRGRAPRDRAARAHTPR